MCFSISGQCWSNSILQLWNFNELAIDNIQTKKEVLDRISYFTSQGTSNTEFVPSNWLGDISYDEAGEIIGAKAAKMLYVIQATSTDEMNTKILVITILLISFNVLFYCSQYHAEANRVLWAFAAVSFKAMLFMKASQREIYFYS